MNTTAGGLMPLDRLEEAWDVDSEVGFEQHADVLQHREIGVHAEHEEARPCREHERPFARDALHYDVDDLVGAVAKENVEFGSYAHRFAQAPHQLRRGRIGIAIDGDLRHGLRDLALQRRRQAVGIFHRVQLDQPVGLLDVVGLHRADVVADDLFGARAHRLLLGLSRSLSSAERACAWNPSPCASVMAILPSFCAPLRETAIRLERFWKSYTPSGEEKRAVREVGSTWLGPAQ